MQHPQAHTEVTVWHRGTAIPEQEAVRTRAWPTASCSLPSWHGQTRMVSLDQPNLYLSSLTLANSGASEPEDPSAPQAPNKVVSLPGQPVTCEQTASQRRHPQRLR